MVITLVEEDEDDVVTLYYGTVTSVAPIIIIIFILKDVALYDELRHLLFIFPLLIITSLTNLFFYLKKKIFYFLTSLLVIFFISENILLNPYQYTWLNSFAKLKKIEKNFEVDYWGVSNKNIQNKIIEYVDDKNLGKSICVYGDYYIKEFLEPVIEKNSQPNALRKGMRPIISSVSPECENIITASFLFMPPISP